MIFGLSGLSFSQQIIPENFRFGFTCSYLITGNDLGKYWGNSFTAGGAAAYILNDDFLIETEISFSYFPEPENNNKILPSIILLNIPAGLSFKVFSYDKLNFLASSGIQNNTFIFKGEGAQLQGDNYIESEFGVYISAGIELTLSGSKKLVFFYKFQNILTEPEHITTQQIGLRLLL